MNGSEISTYTGTEDATEVIKQWSEPGRNPNASDAAEVTDTGALEVRASETVTVASLTGSRMITELRISNLATDDGRAFRGASSFKVSIGPANTGIDLVRRLDYGVADQTATVLVDGQPVGNWVTAGSDHGHPWRNATIAIPASFTTGKSAIQVTVSTKRSSTSCRGVAFVTR